MARDPFETASDEAFEEGKAPEAAPVPPAAPKPEIELGRDGELPSPPSGSVPRSRRADISTDDAVERARQSPDYVGDYPTGVPRWDEADREDDVFERDPEGERFRDGGTFSNEPGWFQPGPKNAQLSYWLNVGGFVFAFLPIVGAAMAFINRSKVGAELATHYTYSMRTLLLALLYGMVLTLITPPELLGFVVLLLIGWYGFRNLRGLARLGSGQPMPNPGSWTV